MNKFDSIFTEKMGIYTEINNPMIGSKPLPVNAPTTGPANPPTVGQTNTTAAASQAQQPQQQQTAQAQSNAPDMKLVNQYLDYIMNNASHPDVNKAIMQRMQQLQQSQQ